MKVTKSNIRLHAHVLYLLSRRKRDFFRFRAKQCTAGKQASGTSTFHLMESPPKIMLSRLYRKRNIHGTKKTNDSFLKLPMWISRIILSFEQTSRQWLNKCFVLQGSAIQIRYGD